MFGPIAFLAAIPLAIGLVVLLVTGSRMRRPTRIFISGWSVGLAGFAAFNVGFFMSFRAVACPPDVDCSVSPLATAVAQILYVGGMGMMGLGLALVAAAVLLLIRQPYLRGRGQDDLDPGISEDEAPTPKL